jgi:hypothetical protein
MALDESVRDRLVIGRSSVRTRLGLHITAATAPIDPMDARRTRACRPYQRCQTSHPAGDGRRRLHEPGHPMLLMDLPAPSRSRRSSCAMPRRAWPGRHRGPPRPRRGGTHKLTAAPTRRWWLGDSHVIPSVIHQPLRGRTGRHWLDNASDLSCMEDTAQYPVDDPLPSCNSLPGVPRWRGFSGGSPSSALLRCAGPAQTEVALCTRDQIAKISSSNAAASRRLVGSSTASS